MFSFRYKNRKYGDEQATTTKWKTKSNYKLLQLKIFDNWGFSLCLDYPIT